MFRKKNEKMVTSSDTEQTFSNRIKSNIKRYLSYFLNIKNSQSPENVKSETNIKQSQEQSPENIEIWDKVFIQPNENSPIFEGEIIWWGIEEWLVRVKYRDEKWYRQIIHNIDIEKIKENKEKYQLSNWDYSIWKYVKVNLGRWVVLGKIIMRYWNWDNYYKIEIINDLNHIIDLEEKNLDELNKQWNKEDNQEKNNT